MAVLQSPRHKHMPRGDDMNIVETYQLGKTVVHIADDFVAKTPEEIEKVLDDYHDAGWVIAQKLIDAGETV